jgi:hypothetical protein
VDLLIEGLHPVAINNIPTSSSTIGPWIRLAANAINQLIRYSNGVYSVETVTTTYTLQDNVTIINATGAITITLDGEYAGRRLTVKDIAGTAAASNITVSGTIDGSASKVINTNYGVLNLYSDGTQWYEM